MRDRDKRRLEILELTSELLAKCHPESLILKALAQEFGMDRQTGKACIVLGRRMLQREVGVGKGALRGVLVNTLMRLVANDDRDRKGRPIVTASAKVSAVREMSRLMDLNLEKGEEQGDGRNVANRVAELLQDTGLYAPDGEESEGPPPESDLFIEQLMEERAGLNGNGTNGTNGSGSNEPA